MSQATTPPDEVLVDRPDEAQNIAAIIRTIVDDERTRRRWQMLLTVAPWAIAAVFGLFAVGAGVVVARRPVPEPRMEIAIYRSDGTVEAPVERGSLSMDRKKFIVKADLQNFIIAWESYSWVENQGFYARISAMTAGERLQGMYQASWHTASDPENRDTKYGKDHQNIRRIAAITTTYVPGSSGAATAQFLVKATTQVGSSCQWWAANLNFKPDSHAIIPLGEQLAYDPSDVIVTSYFSTPADPAARPFPC